MTGERESSPCWPGKGSGHSSGSSHAAARPSRNTDYLLAFAGSDTQTSRQQHSRWSQWPLAVSKQG